MKQKKTLVIAVCLLAVAALAVGMFFLYRTFSQKPQAGEKHITLTIVDDNGAAQEFQVDTDAQYLLEVLQAIPELKIEGEKSQEFGYTLYTVNGVTADFTKDSAYWALYVNDEYGTYNLADQPVTDEDAYRIQYETY